MTDLTNLNDQQKQTLKNKIITELFNSGEVQKKASGICKRNFIRSDTYIQDDIMQSTMEVLCKKSADEIINCYYDDGKKPKGSLSRLIALSVRIICLRGVANDKPIPSRSWANFMLFASNLKKFDYLNPTEHGGEEVLMDVSSMENNNNHKEMWEIIRSELTEEENESLTYFINLVKRPGRYKKEVLEKRNQLLERIHEILTKHKITNL